MEIILRNYRDGDAINIAALFRDTIHTVNTRDYTPEQINAWAPATINVDKWAVKLAEHYTVIAECNGEMCGFGDMDNTGYFDHLFVHKDHQGKGIASRIVKGIESYAVKKQFPVITVAVSITAKPFFLKQGYVIVKQQEVTYNGAVFTNFLMKKDMA